MSLSNLTRFFINHHQVVPVGEDCTRNMDKAFLRIGALARQVGVGVQTLHYYERLGLLPKADRSAANYRLYPAQALRRVQFIKKAQALGFTLEEIKEILSLRGRGRAPCGCVAGVGRKHLKELDARIAALREFRRALAAIVPKWEEETSRHRKCAGEFCDLIERLPQIDVLDHTGKPGVKNP